MDPRCRPAPPSSRPSERIGSRPEHGSATPPCTPCSTTIWGSGRSPIGSGWPEEPCAASPAPPLSTKITAASRAGGGAGRAGGLAARLDSLAAEATSALDELRELARGIHPAILAEGGLRPALKTLARRCAIPVEQDVLVDRRLPEPIEIAAYYLVAEALTNVAKHAHASTIHVEVDTTEGDAGGVLRVCVRDDGRGGADLAGGSGLVGLQDRVEALGGRLRVQSAPGAGTTVRAELPLGPARAASG
jgi:signal transduction histidine kinase